MKSLSRLELEAIVRGIPAAVIVIEKATGRIIYGNDIANSLFGVGLKGLTITSDTERIVKVFSSTGGRYSFDKLPVRQALAKGIEVEDEFVIERPDGSRVVVRGLAKPVKDEHGSITAAVGIFEDITQRKTYEEGLRESQERFRLVAEAAKVLVYELNLEKGNIVILRGEDVIGYKTGEIPRDKQWWLNQIHPEDRVYTEENLRKAVDKGADYFLEYRIKCKSGNYIIAHDTGKAIANVEGKVTKFVSGMRDVTERKKAEQDLRTRHDSEPFMRIAMMQYY
jgi:PAS domain S-box-containing protein